MRFQVPQFIEVEDKIFGPLTLKQFIYIAGGLGLSFILYTSLPIYLSAPVIMVVVIFSAALAFFRFNKRFPFIYMVEAAVKYYLGGKLYIWRKVDKIRDPKAEATDKEAREAAEYASIMVPKISDSKLKDLTWSLDVKESLYNNQNQR